MGKRAMFKFHVKFNYCNAKFQSSNRALDSPPCTCLEHKLKLLLRVRICVYVCFGLRTVGAHLSTTTQPQPSPRGPER